MAPAAIVFYVLASVCVVSSVMVVTRRNPVHAALFLVLAFFAVAGIYVVLSAEFLAAVQVLVYAGGIMVLFLFVIMLVPLDLRAGLPPARHVAGSLLLAAVLAAVLVSIFWDAPSPAFMGSVGALTEGGGNIEAVGMELYRRYLLPFEIASVLLLVAMVGAVVLARPRI
ncbi:MAG TPA: NADH-quinone oxidoreductase subunit J [Candidatus Polarisedimenticolia bacterium]|nr:NADH-quinone oxidoreductase subunit J [Candidatus Polarisedimenticolia bacterium]